MAHLLAMFGLHTIELLIMLALLLLCAVLGAYIGAQRNATAIGAVLGLFFGPLGLLVAALAVDRRPACPFCHGRLDGQPMLCPHCRSELSAIGQAATQTAPRE